MVLAIGFAGALVAPLSGQGFMGLRDGNLRFAATNLLMHAVWGVLVGVIAVSG